MTSYVRLISLFLAMALLSRLLHSLSSGNRAAPRTIFITGATDGIGKHTSQLLAADGNHMLIHGRRPELAEELEQNLLARGAKSACYLNADLNDLEQVEQLARDVLQKVTHLDVLINNAGIFDPPSPAKSVQGYDQTWAVNVMAPYVLTRRLLPLLVASLDPCPRIITTSSISQSGTLPSMDELFDSTSSVPKSRHRAYSDSKLGDMMFTVQLAHLLNEQSWNHIKCLTMDPGTVNTKMLMAGWGPIGINVKKADNTYKLATDYGSQQESGTYHFGGGGSRDAKDKTKLKELFQRLEQATGCTYNDIGTIVKK